MKRNLPLFCCIALIGSSLILVCNTSTSAADLKQPPDTLTLSSLARKYEAVSFDHELHDSYASCVECHHHVAGKPPSNPACVSCHRQGITAGSVACKTCHPADRFSESYLNDQNTTKRYHIDTPGLLGAYHLRCITCHEVIGTGPTECLGCHEKAKS